MLFVDDSIFAKANSKEAELIKHILVDYFAISGQTINFPKSALSFNSNNSAGLHSFLASILRVNNVCRQDRFLGLPSVFPRSKSSAFGHILDQIQQKVASWKEKLLSRGGKEVLIKAVT